jgi:hypothetical protein
MSLLDCPRCWNNPCTCGENDDHSLIGSHDPNWTGASSFSESQDDGRYKKLYLAEKKKNARLIRLIMILRRKLGHDRRRVPS